MVDANYKTGIDHKLGLNGSDISLKFEFQGTTLSQKEFGVEVRIIPLSPLVQSLGNFVTHMMTYSVTYVWFG